MGVLEENGDFITSFLIYFRDYLSGPVRSIFKELKI